MGSDSSSCETAYSFSGFLTSRQSSSCPAQFTCSECFVDGASSSPNGGAICLTSPSARLSVQRTTFCKCYVNAILSTMYGGAIYTEGIEMSMTQWCCAIGCQSNNSGNFADFYSTVTTYDINDTNCVTCTGTYNNQRRGTIPLQSNLTVTFKNMNFTSCRCGQEGSAISVLLPGSTFSCAYITFLNDSGVSVVDSYQKGLPLVQFCSVLDNPASGGAIFGNSYGMDLQNCVFQGNNKDLGMYSVSSQFQLTNCIFGEAFPSSSWVTIVSGCASNTVTASIQMAHFHTAFCPAASPTASKSPSPTVSDTPSPTVSLFFTCDLMPLGGGRIVRIHLFLILLSF